MLTVALPSFAETAPTTQLSAFNQMTALWRLWVIRILSEVNQAVATAYAQRKPKRMGNLPPKAITG